MQIQIYSKIIIVFAVNYDHLDASWLNKDINFIFLNLNFVIWRVV